MRISKKQSCSWLQATDMFASIVKDKLYLHGFFLSTKTIAKTYYKTLHTLLGWDNLLQFIYVPCYCLGLTVQCCFRQIKQTNVYLFDWLLEFQEKPWPSVAFSCCQWSKLNTFWPHKCFLISCLEQSCDCSHLFESARMIRQLDKH